MPIAEYVIPSFIFINKIKRESSLLIIARLVWGNKDKRKLKISNVIPVLSFNAFSDFIELYP